MSTFQRLPLDEPSEDVKLGDAPEASQSRDSVDRLALLSEAEDLSAGDTKPPSLAIPTRPLSVGRRRGLLEILGQGRLALAFTISALLTAIILLFSPVGTAVSPLVGGHLASCASRPTLNWSAIDTQVWPGSPTRSDRGTASSPLATRTRTTAPTSRISRPTSRCRASIAPRAADLSGSTTSPTCTMRLQSAYTVRR